MRVKVVDLDIRHPRSIDGLTGYDAVEILFRDGRDPVGRAQIPCDNDCLELENVLPYIEDLPPSASPESPPGPLPTVTVAICTRNRPEELTAALRSLERQVYQADEVLVVDNGCQKAVRDLVNSMFPHARYIAERLPGLDFARNRALSEATGEIIAFLDDDAVADPYWVRSIVECFATFPGAGAVTGLILPLELETPAQQLFENNGGFGRGFARRVLPRDCPSRFGLKFPLVAVSIGVGSGCNMAFRTAVLRQLNGFDEALDTGPPLPGGGDLDIFYRVMRAGHELVYEPRALIRHCHRRSNTEIRRQLAGHHRSLSAFLVKTFSAERGFRRTVAAIFLGWRLVKTGVRPLRRLFRRDYLPLLFLVHIFLASLAGLCSYQASKRRIRSLIREFGGRPPGLAVQLSDLWRFRELIWNLTARDLKVKYQRSWLGFLWTLLNPLVTVGVLVTVFSYVVRLPIGHYWAFLISGYFAWNFFSQTLNGGVQAALGNSYLTQSAYFPQEVLVVSSSLARLMEFLGELGIVLAVLAIFHHKGIPSSFTMVLLLVPILFFLAIGVSLPLVSLSVYYKDSVQIIPVATMVLFYLSPVFYNVELVPESIRSYYLLNPMAVLLTMYHDALYAGKMPDLHFTLGLTAGALTLGLLGYLVFNTRKRRFSEIL